MFAQMAKRVLLPLVNQLLEREALANRPRAGLVRRSFVALRDTRKILCHAHGSLSERARVSITWRATSPIGRRGYPFRKDRLCMALRLIREHGEPLYSRGVRDHR